MIESYWEQAPADHQHSVSHFRSATVDNQVDEKRKTEKRGNDQRNGNGLGSLPGRSSRRILRKNTIGEPIRHLLSVPAVYSNRR